MKSYNQKPASKYIIYLEANSFYGCSMTKFLLAGGFKWIDPKKFDSNKYINDFLKNFVLEVDHEYPKELRELFNDYLSVPDEIEIK